MKHLSEFLAIVLTAAAVLAAPVGASMVQEQAKGAAQQDESTQQYFAAARTGDIDRAKQLLESGVDVDAVTEFNCGAVYFAANNDQAEFLKFLIESGANVNLRDTDYGFTPVQMSAWLGHTKATGILMDAGATDGPGAVYAAASNGHAGTVKMMIEKLDADQGTLNRLWTTANSNGATAVCKMLEEAGAVPPASTGSEDAGDKKEAASDEDAEQTKFDFSQDRAIPVATATNWSSFRGPGLSGIADGQHPPVSFNLESGRNIAWTQPVPGLGLSSPIIQDGKIYITTAVSEATKQTVDDDGLGWIAAVPEEVPHQWKLQCHDLKTGTQLWETTACEGLPVSARHWKASQANPTCATDGRYIIASFGSQGIYCFDMQGQPLWDRDFGELKSGWYIDSTFEWGFASSPVIYKDSVIVQCDTSEESWIAAFSLNDGSEIWKTDRTGELPSWGTPLVVEGAEPGTCELVTNASRAVRSYNPDNGELLWEVRGNSTITVASPIEIDDTVLATGGYKDPKPIYVVRKGARDDVTPQADESSDAIVWSRQNGGVYVVTPLYYRGLLYMCKQNGVLTVYDPGSGEQVYRKRLPINAITASPVAADGRIYFTGESGEVVVLQAGDTYTEITTSDLGESTLTTPAISDGSIVFRTVKGLIAVAFKRN